MATDEPNAGPCTPPRPTPRFVAGLAASYLLALAVATYPAALTISSRLPGGSTVDSLQHLWTMRWYKACLLEGRSPFFCPEVQYPVGAPLGNYSPTTLQSLIYLPLSAVIHNDILCYNLIWTFSFLFTALGTFLLAWHLVRDRACAAVAGLLAMLSTPMLMHSGGHLELTHVGCFPVFLVAWMRFVDEPRRGRLLAAVGAYVLVAISSPYFVILAVFPAAWYVAQRALQGGIRRAPAWLRGRGLWLAAFAGLSLLVLPLAFSGQLWNLAHGLQMARPRSEFERYGAPLWSYLLPTIGQRLGRWLLPIDAYRLRQTSGECISYLGVVTLALIACAAVRRAPLARGRFAWSLLGLLVLLSLGASTHVGDRRVPLPGEWLWKAFPPYRLMRVPARFNLFAAVVASVVAAAGLRSVLGRLRRPSARAALLGVVVLVALVDLAPDGFATSAVPPLPPAYRALKQRDPRATLLEVPLQSTAGAYLMNSLCGYWQSQHRMPTSAAYSAHANPEFEDRLTHTSPFFVARLIDPNYLADPAHQAFDVLVDADFASYAWLYTRVNGFRYIVVHREAISPELPIRLDRLRELLRPAQIHEDERVRVYDVARLARPTRPTLLCTDGWRQRGRWRGRSSSIATRAARLAAFNPDGNGVVRLGIELEAFRRPKDVRLRAGVAEIARWRVEPGRYQLVVTPPFRLPAGLQELTLESDGEERPAHKAERGAEGDDRPYSLRVNAINFRPATPDEAREYALARGGVERR